MILARAAFWLVRWWGAWSSGDDLWVEGGAAGGHPVQCFDELTDVGDTVLEQVPDKLGLAPSDADHRRVLAVLRYLES